MSARSELPGMWEEADLSGGWADTDGGRAEVNARDAIDSLGDCYLTPGVHKRLMALVTQLLDEHAHELAEQIREEARQYGKDDAFAMKLAAKLIDPKEGTS